MELALGMSERQWAFRLNIPGPCPVAGNHRVNAAGVVYDTAGKRGKPWRLEAQWLAKEAMHGRRCFEGALLLAVVYVLPRPKAHFRADGTLHRSAPHWPTRRPDLLKRTRALEDALTGVVWVDDAQIVVEETAKRYAAAVGDPVRTIVHVAMLP